MWGYLKKFLDFKKIVSAKWQILKNNIMFRLYKRFVFWKNSILILWTLFTGDIFPLLYSFSSDLDNILGRPQTLLQALAKAKELAQDKIDSLTEEVDDETKWEKTKRFLYDYRWYIIGFIVVVGVASVWALSGSGPSPEPSPSPSPEPGASASKAHHKYAPFWYDEGMITEHPEWILKSTDRLEDLLLLKPECVSFEEELLEGLPSDLSDWSFKPWPPSTFGPGNFLTKVYLPENINWSNNLLQFTQLSVVNAQGDIVPYYILPLPLTFAQDNSPLEEYAIEQLVAYQALSEMMELPSAEANGFYYSYSFVGVVDPESARANLLMQINWVTLHKSTALDWKCVPISLISLKK